MLPIEDIDADPNAVLRVSKKTSSAYRGKWTKDGEERVVAAKLLRATTVHYEVLLIHSLLHAREHGLILDMTVHSTSFNELKHSAPTNIPTLSSNSSASFRRAGLCE